MQMHNFKVGQIALYHEEDYILKVKVMNNDSTDTQEKYKLKVLEISQESSFIKTPQIGEEFECNKISGLEHMVGVGIGGTWRLLPESYGQG